MQKILASCHSLEKLSLDRVNLKPVTMFQGLKGSLVNLTPSMIKSICMQNGQTLQALRLDDCKGIDLRCIQQIFEKCTKLEELLLKLPYDCESSKSVLNYLAQNLPTSVKKLDLGRNEISDEHLDILIPRCTHLKSLALLYCREISSRSVTTIINHLKHSLEELDLNICKDVVTLEKLLELNSMTKLNLLICSYQFTEDEMIILKKNLPQVKKVKHKWGLDIAEPKFGFWHTDVKKCEVFQKNKSY